MDPVIDELVRKAHQATAFRGLCAGIAVLSLLTAFFVGPVTGPISPAIAKLFDLCSPYVVQVFAAMLIGGFIAAAWWPKLRRPAGVAYAVFCVLCAIIVRQPAFVLMFGFVYPLLGIFLGIGGPGGKERN